MSQESVLIDKLNELKGEFVKVCRQRDELLGPEAAAVVKTLEANLTDAIETLEYIGQDSAQWYGFRANECLGRIKERQK